MYDAGTDGAFWGARLVGWSRNKACQPPRRRTKTRRNVIRTHKRMKRVAQDHRPSRFESPSRWTRVALFRPSFRACLLRLFIMYSTLAPIAIMKNQALKRKEKNELRKEGGVPNVLSKANVLGEKISHGHCPSMNSWDNDSSSNNSDSWTRKEKKRVSSIYRQISPAVK